MDYLTPFTPTLQLLEDYRSRGLLSRSSDPATGLIVWKYSRACTYNRSWDLVTINCRGLITDRDGRVVARPFGKFFNLGELPSWKPPALPFDVFDKVDGSLGIAFFWDNKWRLSTAGSLLSDQALVGNRMLADLDTEEMDKSLTYLFEIVYNDNVIVLRYPFEGLVLLGAVRTATGEDIHPDIVPWGGRRAERLAFSGDLNSLRDMVPDNREGFVVRFTDGQRVKVKGDEYLRLHSAIFGVTTIRVWEALKEGRLNQYLEPLPDEVDMWVRAEADMLIARYREIEDSCRRDFAEISAAATDRAKFALMALKRQRSHVLFSMFSGRDYSNQIWEDIRPKHRKFS
jgi:RNA ligase